MCKACMSTTSPQESPGRNKLQDIKQRQAQQLQQFEAWADANDWKMFGPEYSHYDWWMFPVTRPSASYGIYFSVNPAEITQLKSDEAFMHNYRRGVELVVNSWGWDLIQEKPIPDELRTSDQQWTGYGVRLGKMADSLYSFGEIVLYRKLQLFFKEICVPLMSQYPLESWVEQVLKKEIHK